jgi:hypothetical protein
VVTQVAKQYREQMAVALLAVAVIYLGSGLGLLFKSYENLSIGFADKSALDGYVFTHPVLVASLVIAVLLVAVWGEPSRHARTIVLAAVGIGAVALVFAVITWIAAFSADEARAFAFTGILGAGKVVGAFVGVADIVLLVLALFFAGMALQALPAPARATGQWGQYGQYNQAGWGPAPDWQQQGQWSAQQYQQYQQQQQQQPPPWASSQSPWGQPAHWTGGQPQQPPGWGHPSEQGWQHPGPGWQQQPAGYDAGPTQAYEQPAEAAPETPASNADRYWRSATPEESTPWSEPSEPSEPPEPSEPSEPAQRSEPTHLAVDESTASDIAAADVADTAPAHAPESFAEPGEHADTTASDAEQTTVGSWSGDAGPSASELAAESSDDEGHTEPDGGEHTDDSGWWRPSSRP